MYAVSDCNKLQFGFLSRHVLKNINRTHYHPVLKLISAINNLTNNNAKKMKLLIVYNINGYLIYLND